MPERLYANVNPALLKWARETAGLTLDQAAKGIGTTTERLESFERGDLQPTVRQLREAARVYKRPLAVFFLDSPPPSPEPLQDFRRLPGVEVAPPSPKLLLEMRKARRRRLLALDLFTELGADASRFPLAIDLLTSVDDTASAVREWLAVELREQQGWLRPYEALSGWISAVEANQVLVFQTSDVPLDEMRGFSISEPVLPAIVVNGKDAPRARVFTLMHELVHLALRQSGLCNPLRATPADRTPDERVETYCNRTAGAILIPAEALLDSPLLRGVGHPQDWEESVIRELAERFAVSREVVLFRLLSLGLTSGDFVIGKLAAYRREYARQAERRPAEGFMPIYRRAVRNNGRLFTRLVIDALEREQITLADASDYLSVRLRHLDRIADEVGAGVA